jgi:glycosyltransferase involved in cell wall biosynthesis
MPVKNIVIDARLYGPKHTGIGRYTKNLLIALSSLPQFSKYRFTIITYNDLQSDIQADLGNKYQYVFTDIPHYSLLEQIRFPSLLTKLHPDLVHFTHFNKPLFYTGNSVVTIHDLIKHYFHGSDTTTKNPLLYWPKYLLYRLLTDHVIKTNQLIVPTVYWQKKLSTDFNLKQSQITVTEEAVDPKFLNHQLKIKNLKIENYLVYTGNLYPHKNLSVLLQALKLLPNINLKIISARSFFTDKLQSQIKSLNLQAQVEFLGYLTDAEFTQVYSKALALVHPSLMEGFSLTGLEAMALNCPVISSNASCLPEVYGQSVLYFDPLNPSDLVSQIKNLQGSATLRQKLIKLGQLQVAKYSWTKTAQKTMAVYEKLLT